MNKNDLKLVGVLLIIIIIFFIIINITKKEGKTAVVYYEDKEILKIDLNTNKEYTVKGYLGDVVLEVNNKKIRVKEETSDKHICSKEGYIYTNNKSLVCMPNKIIVKIISEDNDLDGVVY